MMQFVTRDYKLFMFMQNNFFIDSILNQAICLIEAK